MAVRNLPAESRPDWTLGDLFAVFRRRRSMIVWPVAAMLALVTAYCLLCTPRYQATGQIEVQKDAPGSFELQNSATHAADDQDSGALDSTMTLETDARILESSTLALQVIHDLRLETTADYYPEHKKGIGLPPWLFFWRKPVEPMSIPIGEAPNRRYVVLKIFAAHLKVAPVAGTRLIEVSYSDPDPRLAAEVVNHLIQALSDYAFQQRANAVSQSSAWLAGQLAGLRKQTAQSEERAVRLERETGAYGNDGSHNLVLARLEGLNDALARAESNRILKEAIYRISQSGDPELISGLAGNSAAGATPAVSNSLALIQNLRAQEAAARAELAENDARYGPSYPRIGELQAHLDGIEKSIQEEVQRIGERSRTDYEIAVKAEEAAQGSLDEQKKLANEMNDKTVAYGLAKLEADGSRNVYQSLLSELKQAGALEGLKSTNVSVVDPGRVPPSNHPRSPNLPLYYAAALAAGLFVGCGGALVGDFRDHSIRSLDEMENLLGVPLLGVVPRLERQSQLWQGILQALRTGAAKAESLPLQLASGAPDSRRARKNAAFLEALRSLRTSLLIQSEGQAPKTILVSSSIAGEGKTKVAVHLAAVLAQLGARVLLVDADLRSPAVHRELGLDAGGGLAAALAPELDPEAVPEVHTLAQLPLLSVICGSEPSMMAAELLASSRMSALLDGWRQEYDFVLFDSPPLLFVTDAMILSQMCDATLLVARHRFTAKQAIQRGYQIVRQQFPERAALGVVLNGVEADSAEFYDYYGYKYAQGQRGRKRKRDANA